tara:strand:+ start:615 stop:1142 length:528 start_codon:yes stop_codon:yes gene_type:complete
MNFHGYLCEVNNPKELIELAAKVRDSGYTKFDTYSPFPIHGIDKAMGIPPSVVPILSFIGCIIGLVSAFALQIWTNGIDYKIALSGKPFAAIPAFIPVAFELTILFTAFFTVFGMFGLNQLPTWNRPIFNNESIKKATCSGFFLSISSNDKNFDEIKTQEFLSRSGGINVERIEE